MPQRFATLIRQQAVERGDYDDIQQQSNCMSIEKVLKWESVEKKFSDFWNKFANSQ